MSTPSKPAGYAPDMFSEHARLAQLGARVLEILRENSIGMIRPEAFDEERTVDVTCIDIRDAARSLGLLPEGGAK